MSTSSESVVLGTLRSVAVGSTNPVKVAAVRAVLGRVAPIARIEARSVPSTVRDQPFVAAEPLRGALARARAVRAATGAELGIGIEGGVVELESDQGMRTCAWAAVVDAAGRQGVGGSLAMPLPPTVARLIRDKGLELGVAMDRITGEYNTKHRQGAVGILTAGLVDRQAAYEVLVTYALAPFLTPELW